MKVKYNQSSNIGHEQGGQKRVNLTTEWQRFTYTFVASPSWNGGFAFMFGTEWIDGQELYVHSIELVESNSLNVTSSQKKYSSTLGTLETPVRSGYTFLGWYTLPIGGTQITNYTTVTNNITYYAHWKYNSP